jgi:hypothetical protein
MRKVAMKRLAIPTMTFALLAMFVLPAAAQSGDGVHRVTVPLTSPDRPVMLHASLLSGGIRVEGYDGKEVVVEVDAEGENHREGTSGGMRRIPNTSLGLTVEEEDNVVGVRGSWSDGIQEIHIKVPRGTSMRLSCVNNGDISVSGVQGELELKNVNGEITATDIDGWVVAHTTNGDVKVTFGRIQEDKAMSFVTFNGDVDVSFPRGLKADLRVNAGRGEIFTDFEFQVKPQKPQIENEREGGRYRVRLESEVKATIGGGGPEMYFKTWQGDVFIRESVSGN